MIPMLRRIAASVGTARALDLFTGTTRVAQALKADGIEVTAVDTARYAEVFARTYIATDAAALDMETLRRTVADLDALPGVPGYVTETFCTQARFFQPANGARIDAVRAAIGADHAGSPLEPILLTSLLEAADRVDSTTGVQMAYVKQWAPRSFRPLRLEVPALLAGPGHALRADAVDVAGSLGPFDLVYLDPPYNQHRYFTNYHIWETLVAGDQPPHYGIACKRADARDPSTRTLFDSKRTMPDALASVIRSVDCGLLVLSYNDESWLPPATLESMCAPRGTVAVATFDAPRYVGARIGIHDPQGQKVGTIGRLRNREILVLAGDRSRVVQAASALGVSPAGGASYEVAIVAESGRVKG